MVPQIRRFARDFPEEGEGFSVEGVAGKTARHARDPNGISSECLSRKGSAESADGIRENGIAGRDNDVCFPGKIALDTRYRVSLRGQCDCTAGCLGGLWEEVAAETMMSSLPTMSRRETGSTCRTRSMQRVFFPSPALVLAIERLLSLFPEKLSSRTRTLVLSGSIFLRSASISNLISGLNSVKPQTLRFLIACTVTRRQLLLSDRDRLSASDFCCRGSEKESREIGFTAECIAVFQPGIDNSALRKLSC